MPAQFIMVTAPAKLNLYLGVHEDLDARGYHKVDTVMTAIDLADTLTIAPAKELSVRMEPEGDVPMEENTAYRAARAMGEAFDRNPSFAVVIDKHIPARSGLGGPSADAAATIMGICHFWKLDPADPRVDAVARSIGADVPFFLYGPPAYFSGAGDVMEEIFRPLTGTPVALVKPFDEGVSARDAYVQFDKDPVGPGDLEAMLRALRDHDEERIFSQVSNNLAPAAARLAPKITQIVAWLRDQEGVRAANVTGSGAACFAVCDTKMHADKIVRAALNEHDWWAQTAKMEKSGPFITVG